MQKGFKRIKSIKRGDLAAEGGRQRPGMARLFLPHSRGPGKVLPRGRPPQHPPMLTSRVGPPAPMPPSPAANPGPPDRGRCTRSCAPARLHYHQGPEERLETRNPNTAVGGHCPCAPLVTSLEPRSSLGIWSSCPSTLKLRPQPASLTQSPPREARGGSSLPAAGWLAKFLPASSSRSCELGRATGWGGPTDRQ